MDAKGSADDRLMRIALGGAIKVQGDRLVNGGRQRFELGGRQRFELGGRQRFELGGRQRFELGGRQGLKLAHSNARRQNGKIEKVQNEKNPAR